MEQKSRPPDLRLRQYRPCTYHTPRETREEPKVKQHILSEIQRLAKVNDGRAPGQKLFEKETGIAPHQWLGKFWARWGDALNEAGFEANKWTERLDSNQVLLGVIEACRHYGKLPTKGELGIYRKSNPSLPSEQAIKRHFGRLSELVQALNDFAKEHADYADILPLLPEVKPQPLSPTATGRQREGFVYLFQSGDFYKIGRSDNIERRIKEIRVSLPEKLTPIHSIRTDDPPGIEAYWHNRFADKRANGEWFRLTSSDVSAFRKRKYQ